MPKPESVALAKPTELTDEQKDMVALEQSLLEADFAAHSADRFPVRFLQKQGEIDATEKFLKEEYRKCMAEIAARRRALELRFGREFRAAVTQDLKDVNDANPSKKPRRLIRYTTGQAGLRKSPDKVVVHDEGEATKWAWANCKEACDIKLARTKPLLEHVKETGEEIPGAEFVEGGDKPSPRLEALDALPAPAPEAGARHTPVLPEPQERAALGDIAEPMPATASDGMPF